MSSKQTKGLQRNTIDKYYTKDGIVDLCIDFINHHINIQDGDLIIEPSAGNGAFINRIKTLTDHYMFYDIEPEAEEIVKQDYLAYDYQDIQKTFDNIHIIGNPPFGRQSSIAIKFIK